jgi:hypothetical protein
VHGDVSATEKQWWIKKEREVANKGSVMGVVGCSKGFFGLKRYFEALKKARWKECGSRGCVIFRRILWFVNTLRGLTLERSDRR